MAKARSESAPLTPDSPTDPVYLPPPWRRVILVGFAATVGKKVAPLVDAVAEGVVVESSRPNLLERPGQLGEGDLLLLAEQITPRLEALEWVRQLRESGIETPALVLVAGEPFVPAAALAPIDVLPRKELSRHVLARSLGFLRQGLGDARLAEEVRRRLRAFGVSHDNEDEHRRLVEMVGSYRSELEEREDELEKARARIAELEATLAGQPPAGPPPAGPHPGESAPDRTGPPTSEVDPALLAQRTRELETEVERLEGLRQGQAAAIAELRRRLGDGENASLPGGVNDLMARLMVSEFMRTSQLQNLQYLQQRLDHLESHFGALADLLETPQGPGEPDPSRLLEQVGERLANYERTRHEQQGAIDRLSHSLAVQQVDDTFDDAQTRRNVLRRMDDALSLARSHQLPLACLLVAIDRPTGLREEYGSVAYDYVLVQLAQRLKLTLRSRDVLLRYDHQSFVLLTDAASTSAAYHHARRLVDEVGAEEVVLGSRHIPVSISIAISLLHPTMEMGGDLLRRTQAVLDKARSWGIAQVAVDPRAVKYEKDAAGDRAGTSS